MGYNREKYLKKIQPKMSMGKSILIGELLIFPMSIIGMSYWEEVLYSEATGYPVVISIIIGICIMRALYKYYEKNNTIRRKYITLIENQRETSIDKIAHLNNTTYEGACKIINEFIENGVLENTYIDDEKREVILPTSNIDITAKVYQKSVECPTCGATVTIYSNKENKCEYCNTSIPFKTKAHLVAVNKRNK